MVTVRRDARGFVTPAKEIEENKKISKRKNTKITLIRVSSEWIYISDRDRRVFCVSVAGTT